MRDPAGRRAKAPREGRGGEGRGRSGGGAAKKGNHGGEKVIGNMGVVVVKSSPINGYH